MGEKFNLKRWSQTLILLQEKKLLSEDALHQRIARLQTQHDDALAVVKDMDARMVSLGAARASCVYRQYKPLAQKLQTVESRQVQGSTVQSCCLRGRLRLFQGQWASDSAGPQTGCRIPDPFLGKTVYTRYKKAQIELRELRTQQNVEAFFRKEERSHAVPQQEVK